MLTSCVVVALTLAAHELWVSQSGDRIVLWLANAFAAAMWVRGGKGRTFDLSFGTLILASLIMGEILSGSRLASALVSALVNIAEVVIAVSLMRRFAPGQSMTSVGLTIRLIGVAAFLAPLAGAVIGAIALAALNGTPLVKEFQSWWLAHALGMVLIVPMVTGFNRTFILTVCKPWKAAEGIVLLGALIGLAYAHYVLAIGLIGFVLNMLLVVIAARLRMVGVALAMLAVTVIVFAAIFYMPVPPWRVGLDPGVRILTAQLSLLSTVMPFMLVAALIEERDFLSRRSRLAQSRAELASEAKSRLLANVAHEIKSPVAGVIGIGDLWASGQLGPVNETQKEMAEMLVKTARQVEALAHDLLDVARAESGSVKILLRPTDVVGVLQDVSRSTSLRSDAQGLRFSVEGAPGGLVAFADSQRLTQIIDNLATNAVKYGGSGGAVIFRALRAGANIRIEVSDLGPGLSDDKQAQLFEPFNRLGLERSTIEGHGIGLALAKRLVELQGGDIGVISVEGEGATFWIELQSA